MAPSLKIVIDKVFSRYNLSMSRSRGQYYNGTINMQGRFNGLNALILKENSFAFYIHCFAHELQLAFVVMAKKNIPITNTKFFCVLGDVVNIVGASSKRCDHLQEKQSDFIVRALEKDEILSGRELNQETTFQCLGDTRWGSHYNSLVSLLAMFSSVNDALAMIIKMNLVLMIKYLLMGSVLGMSNELSKALQMKDQDIVNAISKIVQTTTPDND
ncbi:uncharacterized protein LOC111400114 [Olea europaea var. sylvestris]|uniref:uncharacterized protein LOC111400114 n=1 Tax=Olea europaea var. sylvestris TaxID=158386 RepID=UPI000C1CFF1E|nr:uncharacterized protein LOC111400114 [Olea europaea var. sylvestris]